LREKKGSDKSGKNSFRVLSTFETDNVAESKSMWITEDTL